MAALEKLRGIEQEAAHTLAWFEGELGKQRRRIRLKRAFYVLFAAHPLLGLWFADAWLLTDAIRWTAYLTAVGALVFSTEYVLHLAARGVIDWKVMCVSVRGHIHLAEEMIERLTNEKA